MPPAIGITVPKMLPVTGTWSLPFTAYMFLLSGRVVQERLQHEKYMGNQLLPADEKKEKDTLYVAARSYANYMENIPIALLLAAMVELNGGDRRVLNGSLGALLTLRILHVEFGLLGSGTMGHGRPIGYFGTMGVLGGLAGYTAYLVKGYWGF